MMNTRNLANLIPADNDTGSDNATQSPTETSAENTQTVASTNNDKPAEKKAASGGTRKTSSQKNSSSSKVRSNSAKPAADETAKTTTSADAGRPRIPKPGPVTRVTIDLAVTEQRALEKLAGQLGRATDRDRGKNRIHPQHLMRVAVRRLLTDEAFRQAVTADLHDGRDTLKRERRK